PPAPKRAAVPPLRRRRTALVLVSLLLIAVVGALSTLLYVRSQYYVGLDDGHVVVFRGVEGSVAGIDLQSVEERTTLGVERITPTDREHVEDGIVAHDARDARTIVQRLIAAACPTPAPSVAPTPAPKATPVPTPSPTPCP